MRTSMTSKFQSKKYPKMSVMSSFVVLGNSAEKQYSRGDQHATPAKPPAPICSTRSYRLPAKDHEKYKVYRLSQGTLKRLNIEYFLVNIKVIPQKFKRSAIGWVSFSPNEKNSKLLHCTVLFVVSLDYKTVPKLTSKQAGSFFSWVL